MSEFRPRPGEVDDILRRGDRMRLQHAVMTGVAAVLVAGLAAVAPSAVDGSAIQPADSVVPTATATATASSTPPATTPPASPTTTVTPSATAAPVAGTTPSERPGLRCDAAGNGGATDRGVTAASIELFTTYTATGVLPSNAHRLLGTLVDQANRDGGVCGRRLALEWKDDGGKPSGAIPPLEAAIKNGTFAIPFIGLPDAMEHVMRRGYLAKYSTAVVGMPTRDPAFYGPDWVWPAGVSDADAARLMVRDAYRRGARRFAVAFDDPATGQAFDAEVVRLTGGHAKQWDGSACRPCTDADYLAANRGFYDYRPDFVGMLLLNVTTTLKWMRWGPAADDARVPYGYGATETMLQESAREACGEACRGMRVWSAYKASCGAYANDDSVRRYRAALAAAHIDETAQTPAIYAGAQQLLAALRATGPDLTRARFARVLDGTPLTVDLTVAETFTGANRTMRGYDLTWSGSTSGCSLGPVGR